MVGPWIHALFGGEDEDLGDFLSINHFSSTGISQSTYNIKYDKNTDTIIPLQNVFSTTTPTSVIRSIDGVAYQVPAGKKLVFLGFLTSQSTSNVAGKIWSSATVNTADGTTIWNQTQLVNTNSRQSTAVLEIAANQFLTLERVTGGVQFRLQEIVAFETPA